MVLSALYARWQFRLLSGRKSHREVPAVVAGEEQSRRRSRKYSGDLERVRNPIPKTTVVEISILSPL